MNFDRYTVTQKTTGVIIAILLVSFVVHTALILPRFKKHSIDLAGNLLEETARGVAGSIDGVLKQAGRELERLALLPSVRTMDPVRIDETLLLLDTVTANFLSYWVQDMEGIIISRPDKAERVGADRAGRDYFIESISTGKTAYSNFYISNAGNLTTTVGTPIKGPGGAIAGVLVGSLGIDERNIDLFRVITDVSIGKSGFAYLVDREGEPITHTSADVSGKGMGIDANHLPRIEDLLAGNRGTAQFIFQGRRWLAGYSPVPSSGWGVVVLRPEAEIPNFSESLLTHFLSIFVVMFIISSILSIIFVRNLLRPLKLLGQSAGTKLEGFETKGVRDEIKVLSARIGEMVDKIKSSEMELKRINLDLNEEVAQRSLAEKELSFNLAILDLQMERAPDGILVVDTDNKIISYNERFKNIFGIPEELLKAGYDPPVLEFVLHKMVQPEEFLERVQQLYHDPRKRSHEDIHLLDGRVVERHSEPMVGSDDRYYGRVWYFRDITDQKRSEYEIRTSLREKETLLKEVHHRVKNNLQAVSSILDLQSAYLNDNEAVRLCRDSKNRIITIALLHEKLYQGQDQRNVDLRDYVAALTEHLKNSIGDGNSRVRIVNRVAELTLNLDTAIPCGLIITELVTNSIKHAYPGAEEGRIDIDISKDQAGRYRMVVSDDGMGMPAELDLATHSRLGLQLVNSLVEQLSGTMEVKVDKGTTFIITFSEYAEYQGVL